MLRHTDWGESDRLITIFSLEMGKIRVVAKGVRKPRSRKAGHLEPFTRSTIQLARGREILIVTQAEMIDAFTSLHDDLVLMTYAAYVVELLDRFTYEEGENHALYRLLSESLARLCQPGNPEIVVRYYEMRLLDLVGFRPRLFVCVSCGAEIQPQDQFFSAEAGGVICPKCLPKSSGVRPVSKDALRYLRHFQRSSYAEAQQAMPGPLVSHELEGLMQYYLTYLLERGLNTPAFLRRVRNLEA